MLIRNDTIQNYLTDMAKLSDWPVFKFVLGHGRQFGKLNPLPKGEKQGTKQMCFLNAFKLTIKHPELIYCEGFFRLFIVKDQDLIEHHAWAVDKKGNVYDSTWNGHEYFGIPFKPEYVQKTLKQILPESTSLLDNSDDSNPIFSDTSPSKWLHKMKFKDTTRTHTKYHPKQTKT